MAETTTPAAAAEAAVAAPLSPTSSEKSSSSGNGNKFYTLSQSIQQNIEGLNASTKEIEKINDRILFQASTLSTVEESSLIQEVSKVAKETSMKARDTSRLVKLLRVETAKPSGSELKCEIEKSEEEKAEETRDIGDKENICKTVTRSFTDELLLYQSAIQDFKNELKERLTKEVQNFRPKASEDFIDLSLRSESSRYALFREIMATDEQDLTEEQAKARKDEIAEKYVIIAVLSRDASEMNKIFLNLASTANNSSSDSDTDELGGRSGDATTTTRNPYASRASGGGADDLLGNRQKASQKMDESSSTRSRTADDQPQQQRKKNRLFAFMQRHRRASTASAKKLRFDRSDQPPRKRRPGRASRLMTMFLLATVVLAAIVGLVMLH